MLEYMNIAMAMVALFVAPLIGTLLIRVNLRLSNDIKLQNSLRDAHARIVFISEHIVELISCDDRKASAHLVSLIFDQSIMVGYSNKEVYHDLRSLRNISIFLGSKGYENNPERKELDISTLNMIIERNSALIR